MAMSWGTCLPFGGKEVRVCVYFSVFEVQLKSTEFLVETEGWTLQELQL